YGLSRPQELGLLACERPPQGLQAECRGHARVQKNFAERVAEVRAQLAPDTPVEVWFQDEMRVGQKNKLTYRWARKGSRPRAARDQRTQSTYLFGAVCPERGAGAPIRRILPVLSKQATEPGFAACADRFFTDESQDGRVCGCRCGLMISVETDSA